MINNTVDFGARSPSDQVNTSDDSPFPFIAENAGNIVANVTITGTKYFDELGRLPVGMKQKQIKKLKETIAHLKKGYKPEEIRAAIKVKLSYCYKKIKL